MDQVSITTKLTNFDACYRLAMDYGVGLEIQSFAFPPLLNMDDWSSIVGGYQSTLANFPHPISMHGAFMDMAPGSPDPLFSNCTRERTYQSMNLASDLNADTVVFHANFISAIRDDAYRDGWTDRMMEFFIPVAEYAEQLGIQLVLENMWEFDPSIIRMVLDGVNAPSLTACLDVGHAHLFSKLPFRDWLEDMEGWITYIHMNNNYGDLDVHHGLDDGIMNYEDILPKLRKLPRKPRFVLEVEEVEDIERSLAFFDLPEKHLND